MTVAEAEQLTKTAFARAASPVCPPPAFPGMRIGLLGGSFNPAHEGHLHISVEALRRLGLDRIWWLVTPGNPLKSHGELASLPGRIAVARQVAAHPRIDVTGFEAALPTAYTVDTVAYLLRRFRGVNFVWLMGSDNLAQFHRWRQWRKLLAMLPVAVMHRADLRLPALASPATIAYAQARIAAKDARLLPALQPPAWSYIGIPPSYQSSTAIRAVGKP
jgi:nicotinate-nucleotide adenylyltransferase